MSRLNRKRRGDWKARARRSEGRRSPRIEALEERQLLTGPSASINSITVNLSTPGPTSISGSLNPGDEIASYRIDGSAGEQLQFHSVSTSSTGGTWEVLNENNQVVNSAALGTDFTANLSVNGPYFLELVGNSTAAITYSFQVSDASSYPTPSPTGAINTPQSGTIAAYNTSKTFTFTAPGGLPVYLESLGANSSMYAQLTGPGNTNVFSGYMNASGLGPYLLPATGSYTLTVTNDYGANGSYNFNLISLPSAATTLATGPTQTLSGTISSGYGAAVYGFLGAPGERLFVDNQSPYSGPGDLMLVKPDGGQIFNVTANSDGGPLTLTENGTYYLIAYGTSSGALNYKFRLTDTAYAPLTFGSTTSGTITNAAQSDAYSFTAAAGQHVYFHELSNSNSTYSASWYLYGPNNQIVTSNSFSGDMAATLPVAGTYTLLWDNNPGYNYSSGTYSFAAYLNTNPTTALTLGQEYTGTIANPGDTATYTFTGTAGQRIYLDDRAGNNNLVATLTSPYGTQVFNDSLSSGGQGPYTLPQSGTYTLTFSGNGGVYTGSIDFVLDDVSQATTIAMTPGAGTTETGTLSTGYATQLYQFSGAAGQTVYFQGQQDSPGSAAVAWLYAPGASGSNPYQTYTYLENSAQWTLPATGTYLVAVRGQGSATGTVGYKFTLYDNTDPATAMTLGHEYTGTLTNPGDEATYTFTGAIGQQVYLDARDATSGLYAQLTAPNGSNAFTEYFSSGDTYPYTLTQPGTYTLTIQGNGSTGAYDFSLDDLSAATPLTLTPGAATTVTGSLATGLTTSLYTFTGTAGQRVFFQALQDSVAYATRMYLFGPDNNYIDSDYTDSGNYRQWTLSGGGTYTLAAVGDSTTATGPVSYKFNLDANVDPTKAMTLGTEYTGTLANPGDEVTYTFNGTGGQRVYFDPRDQTPYVAAVLTSPTGGQVFNDYLSGNDQGPFVLSQAGPYTLTVYANYGYTGAYDLSLDDTSQAPTLPFGKAISGTLGNGLTTNLYQFSGTAGQRVYFDGLQDSTANGAYAYLVDATGRNATSFYLESQAQATLPTTGTYLLEVNGVSPSTTGPINYQLEAFQNVNPTTAMTLGTEYAGTLTNPGDEASFTFTGSVGQQVYFDPRDQTSGIYAQLRAPDGTSVFTSDYFPSGDYGPYTLTQAGTYTMTVYGSGLSAGAYDFSLDDLAAATPIALTAGSGTTVSGTLATGLTTKLYTFTGTAGQRIDFNGLLDSPSSSAYAYLYGPNGANINSVDTAGTQQWTLSTTGTYLVAVRGNNAGATGPVSYKFTLFDNVNPTTPMTLGHEVTGTLTNPGDQASYTFTGTAGQRLYFDPRDQTSGVAVNLFDPSGTSIFTPPDLSYGDQAPFTLLRSGTYTLTIYANSGDTGAYDFSLDDVSQATGLTLTAGSGRVVSGTLASGLATDLYTFTGTAGQRVYFLGQQSTPINSASVYLYGPNNAQITGLGIGGSSQWTLSGNGTYTIAVQGTNAGASGTVPYQFTLYDNANPTTALTLGQATTATLANPGDQASYAFTGSPGQRVYFDGQSATTGLSATLTNPSGGTIFNIGTSGDSGPYTLSEPGTYTLTISGGGNTGSATFSLIDPSANPLSPTSTATTVSGSITGTGTKVYQIAGTAGDTLTVQNSSFSATSGTWYLYDPSNNTITSPGFSNTSGNVFSQTLGVTGPYELVLRGSDTTDPSINYSFGISLTHASSVTSSGLNTVQSGTLAYNTPVNVQFTAPAGLPVFLDTLTNSNGYLYYTLKDPNGNTVIQNYASSVTTPFILPASGTYTLTLNNYAGSTNTYSVEVVDLHANATALTLGTAPNGTLNPGTSIAAYSFTGTVGQLLALNNLTAANSSVRIQVMDPYGNTPVNVAPNTSAIPTTLTLTSAGTYYVLAVGSSSTPVGYQFRLTDLSTVPLSFGTTVSGTFSNPEQADVYSFSGTAGQNVYFHEISSSNGTYGAYLRLYGPDGQQLTANWIGSDLYATLPVAGTYTLAITNYNNYSSGTYSFTAYKNLNPTAALTLGQEVTGTLTNPGDQATYTFNGTAGQAVYFDNHAGTTGLYATLTSPYGTQVFSDYLSNGGQGPYILGQSGTYTLTLSGNGSYTGKYDFILDDISQATTIALTAGSGTTETGTLATGYATDLYQFSGAAGQTVYFQGQQDSPGSAAVAWLYAPGASGSNPYQTDAYLENSAQWTLPATGTYLVAVRGQGSAPATVAYKFTLYDNTNPATALALGAEYTGTLTNPGDQATYTFTGSVSQRVYFDSRVGTTNLYETLTDPYGNQVFGDYLSSGGRGPFTLTQAGTYTLKIYGYSGATGKYDFVLDDAAQATTIAMTPGAGTTESGTLATGYATQLYQFSGVAGQTVYFQGQQDSPGSAAVAWLYAPGASGSNPYQTDAYLENSGQWTLPATGTYLVAVRGQGSAPATVAYKFTLFDNANPTTALTLGQEYTGTLTNPGDTATFTFTGSVGQQVYFDPRDQTSYVAASLNDPYGTNIFNSYLSSGDLAPYTLTEAGTYTLTIYANSGDTGAYDFSLDDVSQATGLTLTPGAATAVSGTLANGLTTNLYTFTGTAGQRVYFQGLQDATSGTAQAYLYGPGDNGINSSYTENSIQWTLPDSGTYTMVVRGENASAGGPVSYKFNLFDNTDPTAALTLGQEVTGTVINPGDQYTYTFTGSSGQRIYFDPRDATSNIYALLTSPYGTTVMSNYLSSGDQGPYTLTQAGTYTLTVYGLSGATGAFDFILSDLATATALAPGKAVSGTLAGPLATDLYQFSAAAGASIFFDGLGDSPTDAADAYIYNPANGYVYDWYTETSGTVTLPPIAGTYIVAVRGDGHASGTVSYSFEIFANTNPTTALTLGQEYTGSLTNPGDEATYTFTGSVGQQVYFDPRDATSNLLAQLRAPNGISLFTQYFSSNDSGPYTLPQPGTYTLTVYGNGLSVGAFDFSLDDVSQATPLTLTPGAATTVSGTVATGLTTNLYTFSGTAGQRIEFQGLLDSTANSVRAYLYGPNGNYYDWEYTDANTNSQWMLPGTGTYTLAVEGYNASATGPVNYKFNLNDNANPTTAMTLNQEYTGTLTNPGDQATFTFTGSPGQQVQFNGLEPGSNQYARLYDPEGTQVFGQYLQYNVGPYTLATPGTYSLVITTNGTSTGNYDFRLLDLLSSPKLQVGTTEADLTVTLSSAPTQQVLIQYATSDGTAKAGNGDYKPATGLLLFQPGQTTATVETQAINKNTTQTTTYNVVLSAPVGATIAQNGGTGVVTLNSNAFATLNGEVFNDNNGDGSLGGGEPGLSGRTINLLNSSNSVIATTQTASNGTFSFSGVAPGSYTVAEAVPTGWVQTTPPSPGTYAETVTAGQTVNNLNFGTFQLVTIGGQAFNDVNGNGTQDGGDGGLSGVTVQLLDSSNNVVATATSGSGGSYSFSNVGPGIYTVQEVPPSGSILTTASSSFSEHPSSGQNVSGLNFGFFKFGTVAGTVFNDQNGNGTLDSGEPGLSGWSVYLTGNLVEIPTTVYPTFNDTGTDITFSGTPLGTLQSTSLLFGTSTSFNWHPFGASRFATDTKGSFFVPTGGSDTFQLNSDDGSYLFIDGSLVVNDGGTHGASAQSGTVSLAAGIHSFELKSFEDGTGQSGVDFSLPAGLSYALTATTDAQGHYSLPGVGPGTGTVQVVQQPGYNPTTPTSYAVTGTSGLAATDNFGEARAATIGGTVFTDVNGNGVQDAGDGGLSGVTIDLLDSTSKVVATTTSGANGVYSFTIPSPGTYTVKEEVPTGDIVTLGSAGYTQTVTSGQSVANLNFGDFQAVAISGEVYNDVNGNGALDGGEPGISGWTVNLINSQHAQVASAKTDANGAYSFTGIGPGSYTVQEVSQAGYVVTSPASTTYAVTTSSGQNDPNLNFGIFQAVTLSGEVFGDTNGSGTIDTGESGLSNWTVNLLNSSNAIVATATTDANGSYSVTGVGPGRYTLQVVAQGGYLPSTASSYSVTTTSGLNSSGLNFGEFKTATINGLVFNDVNGDGTQAAGDTGLEGWTVNLYNRGGYVTSTTTDLHGNFSFIGVGPGSYTVTETLPTGYVQTTSPTSYTGTPNAGQVIPGLGFGIFHEVTFSGEAFNDANGNGTLDSGESPMSGLTVNLLNGQGQVVHTLLTDTNGDYAFTGVGPGSYTIQEVAPTGYVLTVPASGRYAEAAASGQDVPNLNFGNFQVVSIGGEVYGDTNGNAALDSGEPGLSGWTVTLLDSTNKVVATTQTGTGGSYAFNQVGPGTYTVQVSQQPGYTATTPTSLSVTISSGQGVTGENFGEFQAATVAGEVFNDANGNGTLDGGEGGLSGWTVNLVNASDAVVATTKTAADGTYTLTVAAPGTYTVQEVLQSGYVQTSPTTTTYSVSPTAGQALTARNFGDFQAVTLGGEVFNDNNGDGALQAGELGLANWTVDLINNRNAVIATAQTDSSGHYAFSNVGPGSYTVEQVVQPGYVQTSTPTTYAEVTSSGTSPNNLDFGDFQSASFSGEVFNDANGNGQLDKGESGLSGWTVELIAASTNGVVATAQTDSGGNYSFTGVGPGSYKITELQQSGDQPTTATTIAVTAASGLVSTGNNFGEFQGPTISGEVFNDANGDGVLGGGEGGIANWTVDLLDSTNKVVASAVTGNGGSYAFTGVGPGTYTVKVELQSGFVLTAPASGSYSEPVTSGQGASNVDFGVFKTVTYSGEVFNDNNGDGAIDGADSGIPGWTVNLLDSKGNTVATQKTGTGGTFSFPNLGPGSYTLAEVAQSGYIPTTIVTVGLTAASGQDDPSIDFGQFQTVTVSGEVYDDANDDGALDNGEAGITNWSVNLIDGQGKVLATATTGTGGTYSFAGVGPGSYTVQAVSQSVYVATTPATSSVTTASGQNVTGVNFGEFPTVTVGGEVFADNNGDGTIDGLDAGISGWTVSLIDSTNHVVATQNTAADGTFLFSNVGPGSYTVSETPQSGYVATTATSFPASTTGGHSVSGLDFGQFKTVTLAGEVFADSNGDGAIDGADSGIPGWTVNLIDGKGNTVATQKTGTGGAFAFAGVGPGNYTVQVAAQTGYVATTPTSSPQTTASGQDASGLNFGEFQTVAVSGEVFNDVSGDGVLNGNDTGLSGWTVDLLDSQGHVVNSMMTDTAGAFAFAGVGPGRYTVQVESQSGYTPTTLATQGVTTSSGQAIAGIDVGEFRQVTLSGEVYDDANADGQLDNGESGLSGWTVDLLDSSNAVIASQSTGTGGTFSFSGVGPGSYTVQEVTKAGYVLTSTPTSYPETTASGANVSGLNFGNSQLVGISGEVYNDALGNGVLDGGDAGLSGWTVNLLDGKGNTVATQKTGTGGSYSFTNVAPGSYTVQVAGQTGYLATTATSDPVTIASGQGISGVNFGEFQLVTYGGEVYGDTNGNGALDNGETGLSGWTVNLLDSTNKVVATTTTDSSGDYSFSNVGPGSYTVAAVAQSSYMQTSSPSVYKQTATSGQGASNLNFGEYLTASVLGQVYNDVNGNGAEDSGDAGLSGWTINLLDGQGHVIATTSTNSSGNFSFAGVGPGTYTIQEVTRSGYTPTTATTLPVTSSYGLSSGNNSFGEFRNVSLAGEVYNDLNGDGTLQSGEPGLSGWTVNLVNSKGQTVATQNTDTGGTYSFTNVGPGSFTVQVAGLSGYVATTPTSSPQTTASGQDASKINFGEFQTVTLAGEVYNDANDNGQLDAGESGLSGWTVNLLDAQNHLIQTTQTDSNGDYSFSNVGPGARTVQEVPASGYVPTSPASGTLAVTPTSGTNATSLNFGNMLQQQGTPPQIVDIRVDYGNRWMSLLNLNRNLPFIDINAVEVIFNQDVTVASGDLSLKSLINSGKTYTFSNFSYDSTAHDAKWTLPSAIGIDSLMLAIDGHHASTGTDGVHNSTGQYLGDQSQNFKVLPGDVNGDGIVNSQDTVLVRNEIVGLSSITVWADVNGDSVVDMNDYRAVAQRVGSALK